MDYMEETSLYRKIISEEVSPRSKVLFTVLNWGLGHATRSMPIIKHLLMHSCEVCIASDGLALELLQKEFPNVQTLRLPSYNISYKGKSMIWSIFLQLPKLCLAVIKENRMTRRYVKSIKPDVIISDHRYGTRTSKVRSIFIGHQISILTGNKKLSRLATFLNVRAINFFDQCWIPDYAGEKSLSGKLSETIGLRHFRRLGAISRLEPERINKRYDIVAILSGPEPQRSLLEKALLNIFRKRKDLTIALVRGTNKREKSSENSEIKILNLATSTEIRDILNASHLVICRSGYTSIMDLQALKKSAILIPTPGQTEQEYLATYLSNKPQFKLCQQSEIMDNLDLLISQFIAK